MAGSWHLPTVMFYGLATGLRAAVRELPWSEVWRGVLVPTSSAVGSGAATAPPERAGWDRRMWKINENHLMAAMVSLQMFVAFQAGGSTSMLVYRRISRFSLKRYLTCCWTSFWNDNGHLTSPVTPFKRCRKRRVYYQSRILLLNHSGHLFHGSWCLAGPNPGRGWTGRCQGGWRGLMRSVL